MIIYLAKAFKEREHAEKFILGEMYCKQLTYFKKLEDREGRGDPDEGAIVLPLEGLDMTLGTKPREREKPSTGTPSRAWRHRQLWFPNGSTI